MLMRLAPRGVTIPHSGSGEGFGRELPPPPQARVPLSEKKIIHIFLKIFSHMPDASIEKRNISIFFLPAAALKDTV